MENKPMRTPDVPEAGMAVVKKNAKANLRDSVTESGLGGGFSIG